MPRKGYKSVTLIQDDYELLQKVKERLNAGSDAYAIHILMAAYLDPEGWKLFSGCTVPIGREEA